MTAVMFLGELLEGRSRCISIPPGLYGGGKKSLQVIDFACDCSSNLAS